MSSSYRSAASNTKEKRQQAADQKEEKSLSSIRFITTKRNQMEDETDDGREMKGTSRETKDKNLATRPVGSHLMSLHFLSRV